MRCEVCNRGPAPDAGGVTVHRVNELGVSGIWRCKEHLTPEQMPDEETLRLVEILEKRDL